MNKELDLLVKLFGDDQIKNLQTDTQTLGRIYGLFINNTMFDPINETENLSLGLYCTIIKNNPDFAIKYYLSAAESGNVIAMNNLAYYYQHIQKDYINAKKYYQMAAERGYDKAIINLALFCNDIEKNKEEVKKYISMRSINHIGVMNNLPWHLGINKYDNAINILLTIAEEGVNSSYALAKMYHNKEDYLNAEKYYLMAIDCNKCPISMNNLGVIYEKQKNYLKAEKYYIMSIEHEMDELVVDNLRLMYDKNNENIKLLDLFIKYQKNIPRQIIIDKIIELWNSTTSDLDINKHLINLLSVFEFESDDKIPYFIRVFGNLLKQKIDTMKLHFEYNIEGKGFEEAKEDFIKLVSNNI